MIPRTLFSAEHELFRDQVRRFIAAEITPDHAAWATDGIVPRSAWLKAGEAGRLCTEVPEEYGGGDFLFGAIMIERTARAGATGPSFYLLAQERLVQAIRAIASSEAAPGWTLDHTLRRKMVGQTLADLQNTQFTLAEMKAELTLQGVFVDRCIDLHSKRELDAVEAAMCKLVGAELQGKVMDQCQQFFGGWSYMWEYPVARALVDARLGRIGGGSVEVMKRIIARSMMPDNKRKAG